MMAFFPSTKSKETRVISESLFRGLWQIFGTTEQVATRRKRSDRKEMLGRKKIADNFIEMMSGSRREGFILEGSDHDMMYWRNNHRVIMDMSQSKYYNTANTTLILADSSESPPGFTLLQLLTPTTIREVQSSCVTFNDSLYQYISSNKFRQLTCSAIFNHSTEHGPCGSGVRAGAKYDTAVCFVSDFWPPSASAWIDRCHSWPDPEVVDDIVRNGCHFVAIGQPLGLYKNEEWRISFSQAEYKLVYSMNHRQFCTYGLLKLFLKEVINPQLGETRNILSSYHIKTAIFWAIQQNTLPHWCPYNILDGFWVCFKLLLKWVYDGIFPNFFIPQNNLFLAKIHDLAQNRLFLKLYELYENGFACLLQSPCVQLVLTGILYNPRLSFYTYKIIMGSDEVVYDNMLFVDKNKILSQYTTNLPVNCCLKVLHTLHSSSLTDLEKDVVKLQDQLTFCLQDSVFLLHNVYANTGVNKHVYIADKSLCHMLKLAAKFGYISDLLYIAMYYYKTFRCRKALSVIEMTKFKLAQPNLIYRGRVDQEWYVEAVGGQSWSTKMRQAVAQDIMLDNRICYINELIPEQQSAQGKKHPVLFIPVFVMLHFLEFLCYRPIDTTLSQAALDELKVLVHYNHEIYVHDVQRDISWEILGICQQISGNLRAAIFSYEQSLRHDAWHNIQTATQRRIQECWNKNGS
nr:uncharacterized protein LOC117684278 [Crassostrea gigas]